MEPVKFREDFRRIVYLKGQVVDAANGLSRLEHWNKNGSHDEAIKRAIGKLETHRAKLKDALCGKPYSAWLEASKKLSHLQQRQKRATRHRPDIEQLINDLTI